MALNSYLLLAAAGEDAPQGRIVSVRIVKPNVLDPATARLDTYVELRVVPNVSEVESITGGTLSVDDWAQLGIA